MNWYLSLKYCVVFGLFVVSAGCLHDQATNIEFAENVADSLVVKLIRKNAALVLSPVCIVNAGGTHQINWLFEQRFVQNWKNLTHQAVYIGNRADSCFNAADQERSHKVEYDIENFNIEYRQGTTELGSPDLYRRSVTIEVNARILEKPAGRVVWNGEMMSTDSDWIQRENIPALESKDELYTHGTYRQPQAGSGVLKPIIIATVTGVIVYLFFAFRSR